MTEPQGPSPKRKFHLISPVTLIVLAAVIAAAFGICHAVGMRENTPALFATSSGSASTVTSAVAYVALYLAAVVLAPILAIAAVIMKALQLALARLAKADTPREPARPMTRLHCESHAQL